MGRECCRNGAWSKPAGLCSLPISSARRMCLPCPCWQLAQGAQHFPMMEPALHQSLLQCQDARCEGGKCSFPPSGQCPSRASHSHLHGSNAGQGKVLPVTPQGHARPAPVLPPLGLPSPHHRQVCGLETSPRHSVLGGSTSLEQPVVQPWLWRAQPERTIQMTGPRTTILL